MRSISLLLFFSLSSAACRSDSAPDLVSKSEYRAAVSAAEQCIARLGFASRRRPNGPMFYIEVDIGEGELTKAQFAARVEKVDKCLAEHLESVEEAYFEQLTRSGVE